MYGPITCSGIENIPKVQKISCVARASKEKGETTTAYQVLNVIADIEDQF